MATLQPGQMTVADFLRENPQGSMTGLTQPIYNDWWVVLVTEAGQSYRLNCYNEIEEKMFSVTGDTVLSFLPRY